MFEAMLRRRRGAGRCSAASTRRSPATSPAPSRWRSPLARWRRRAAGLAERSADRRSDHGRCGQGALRARAGRRGARGRAGPATPTSSRRTPGSWRGSGGREVSDPARRGRRGARARPPDAGLVACRRRGRIGVAYIERRSLARRACPRAGGAEGHRRPADRDLRGGAGRRAAARRGAGAGGRRCRRGGRGRRRSTNCRSPPCRPRSPASPRVRLRRLEHV